MILIVSLNFNNVFNWNIGAISEVMAHWDGMMDLSRSLCEDMSQITGW